MDYNTLQAANLNVTGSTFMGTYAFGPVVDGKFLIKRPTEILSERQLNGVRFVSMLPILGILTFRTGGGSSGQQH
jgi:hypothetical protein